MSWKFGNPEIDDHHNNIIGMWPFDEASGTRYDYYGSRDLAEDGGVVASAAGKHNLAADFELGDTEALQNGEDITRNITQYSMSCWIWLESLPGAQDEIIVWESTGSVGYSRLYIAVDTSDRLSVGMRDSQSGSFKGVNSGANTFSAPTWYHILAVIDTVADNISAWVNTAQWINSGVAMGNFHDSASARDWQVGRAISSAPAYYGWFDGLIDELYMWEDALDGNDATVLYNGGSGTFYKNLPANFFCNG